MAAGARARAVLASPRAPWVLALLGTLWLLPTLWQGRQADDHWQAIYLSEDARFAPLVEPAHRLFTFFDGDPARTAWMREHGLAPWWTDPEVHISFLRPLSAATHALDHRLAPGTPGLAHLHSLLWYGLLLVVAGLLYRRLLGAGWAAGLAAALYAFDHTHGVPAAWVANRNALVAGVFAIAAVLAHDRWRRDGKKAAAVAAPLLLAAALFAGETGLGALGFLIAHELCLAPGTRGARARALVPALAVTAAWAVVYKGGGFGAHGSGMYLDPLGDPLAFAGAVVRNAPLLLASELGAPAPDSYMFLPTGGRALLLGLALATLAFAAPALARLARRDATTRFLLLGALLAVLPACAATLPSARVMLLPGLGLIGALAQLGAAVADRAAWIPVAPAQARLPVVAFAALAVGGHALLSPLLLQLTSHQMVIFESVIQRCADGLPADDPRLPGQRVVVVNAPDAFFTGYVLVQRHLAGLPTPRALLSLGVGTSALELDRTDERTLRLRAPGGFYRDRGADLLTTRGDRAMPAGTRVALSDLTIEIVAADAQGVPVEADFRFDAPLEDERRWRFVRWNGRTFVPFELPAVGARALLPAQAIQPF